MKTTTTDRVRVVLLLLSIMALAWAAGIVLSGGFVVRIGGVRVSSRAVWRPLALALVLGGAYVAFTRGRRLGRDLQIFSRASRDARLAAALLAVTVAALGIVFGSCAASGLDIYGYVSQADLWVRGNLHVPQPWSTAFQWHDARWAAVPLGYRPRRDRTYLSTWASHADGAREARRGRVRRFSRRPGDGGRSGVVHLPARRRVLRPRRRSRRGGGGGSIGDLDVRLVAELEKPVRVRIYDPLQPAASEPAEIVQPVDGCFCGGAH